MVGVCVSDKWAGLQLRKGWKWKKISDLVGSSYFMRARIFNFENWIAYTFDIFFNSKMIIWKVRDLDVIDIIVDVEKNLKLKLNCIVEMICL